MFFDSFDAVDPAELSTGLLHVQLGVPSRNGERKAHIVDGPQDAPPTWGPVLENSEIRITF